MPEIVCSEIKVTWYPGAPGATDNPYVLVDVGDDLDAASFLSGGQRQAVQDAEYVGGEDSNHWPVGDRAGFLDFVRAFEIEDPGEAVEKGNQEAAGIPGVEGWLRIQIANDEGGFRDTEWQIDNVGFESTTWRLDFDGLLLVTYSVKGGELGIYTGADPGIYTPGIFLLEDATEGSPASLALEDS